MAIPILPRRIRFGEFEADLVSGELRKEGCDDRILLQDQSLTILRALLAKPGEMVAREDLIQLLWNGNTNVDFDPSLNKAINRLRESLGDSAETPRYVETIARRGYRFIAGVALPPTPATPSPPRVSLRKPAAWTLVGVACVLATAFAYLKISPTDKPDIKPVPFTAYPGYEDCPTFSPDGSQIAFAWDGDPGPGAQGFDLYVKVTGSESLLRLTRHPSERICPAWSPDGTQIAFNRTSGATDTGVYVVSALGGPERRLRQTRLGYLDGSNVPISWSPDGKSIAFVDFVPPNDDWRLNLLSVDTLETKEIPHAPECINEWFPAFSHFGDQLAYLCLLNDAGKEFGIYVVSSSGGRPKRITRFATGFGYPQGLAWTANDKKLILSRPHFPIDFELEEVDISNGSLQRLPFGDGARAPAISSKGDKLTFAVGHNTRDDIWRKDLLRSEAAAMKLAYSTRTQNIPQYSPDGKHIAFTSDRGGSWEIWMSDADGTDLVKLSNAATSDAIYPRWAPDSQKIAFESRHSGQPEVFIVDISERLPRKVITNLSHMSIPSWSHDGKWLYFRSASAQSKVEGIFRCSSTGGEAVAISAKSGAFAWESFDGKELYYADMANNTPIRVISLVSAGTDSPMTGMPPVLDASLWTAVPAGIYFVPVDAPKSVCYFAFATRQIRQVFTVDKNFDDSLSVSPDGRWILYTQIDEGNTDIMLVEHLR